MQTLLRHESAIKNLTAAAAAAAAVVEAIWRCVCIEKLETKVPNSEIPTFKSIPITTRMMMRPKTYQMNTLDLLSSLITHKLILHRFGITYHSFLKQVLHMFCPNVDFVTKITSSAFVKRIAFRKNFILNECILSQGNYYSSKKSGLQIWLIPSLV